ncbi:MAG: MBL fold metallo-hydrolase [Vicinamibacterales bacterium]
MDTLARGLGYIDVTFMGFPRVIATAVLQGPGGVALIDPGPSTCLDTLRASLEERGMTVADVKAVLLTHIHLDHAGATGSLVKENPEIAVYVHQKGAPHMVSPEKLLASAGRLYGDQMETLWGEFAPIPEANIRSLTGGERIDVSDRQLDVVYLPGHASHHVGYFDSASGVAFVGDTAGIRLGTELFATPPTPPPDIDVEAWVQSVELIRNRHPSTLFVTHFGPHEDVSAHLDAFLEHLAAAKDLARTILESDGTDEDKASEFTHQMQLYIQRFMPAQQTDLFNGAPLGPLSLGWLGLRRYWRKQGVGG